MSGPTDAGSSDPRVGTTLSERYRIDALLGEGGMGKVYAAEHVLMRKKLAVKILHRELTSVPEVVQRFEREAMAAANIDHPNVAAATDFGKLGDGSVFLVLEFIEGENLRDEIAKGVMPVERALHIARQIASALASAHELSIVHRDLKPENVMLVDKGDDRDFVKVLDFGIARVPIGETTDGSKPITKVGMVFGTPEYMAPEQALGQPVDGRADTYALGVILFEMISGVRPFSSKSPVGILGQQLSKPPPTLAERSPGLVVPPQVEVLLQKLLAKEASDRPDHAKQVVATIEELIGPTPGKGSHKFTVPRGSTGVEAGAAPGPFSSIPDLEAPSDPALSVPILSPVPPVVASAPSWEVPDGELPSAPEAEHLSVPEARPPMGSVDQSGPHSAVNPLLSAEQSGPHSAVNPLLSAEQSGPHSAVNPLLSAEQSGPHSAAGPLLGVDQSGPHSAMRSATDLGDEVKRGWERLLDAVDDLRDKLPPNIRKPLKDVPTVAFVIAAVVIVAGALVGLIAIVVAVASSDDTPAPTASSSATAVPSATVAPPVDAPAASKAELASAKAEGAEGLQALAEKFPKDARIPVELAVMQTSKRKYKEAVAAVEAALGVDEKSSADPRVATVLFTAAQKPQASADAFRLLQGPMGAKGADIVYDLSRAGNVTARRPAKRWLATPEFQQASSPSLNVLVALDSAKTCRQRYALLMRAKNVGDARVLKTLTGYKSKRAGCGRGGNSDCNPCMRDDDRLDLAIAEIEKRVGGAK